MDITSRANIKCLVFKTTCSIALSICNNFPHIYQIWTSSTAQVRKSLPLSYCNRACLLAQGINCILTIRFCVEVTHDLWPLNVSIEEQGDIIQPPLLYKLYLINILNHTDYVIGMPKYLPRDDYSSLGHPTSIVFFCICCIPKTKNLL